MNIRRMAVLTAVATLLPLAAAGQEAAGDRSLSLKIGDPRFKDKTIVVGAGEIVSAETGAALPFAKMVQEMKGSRLVYIGETHNSLAMHDMQARLLAALWEQDRNLVLGLEMFPAADQEVLNKWSLGLLSEDEFLRESRWYLTWNFNFGFYREIFIFARDHKIPIYGLNAPKEVITKIRMMGWDALSEAEKALVPKPDLSHPEHRQLIRTVFESADIPPAMKGTGLDMMFEGLYRSQSAWDEVMAANALEASRREQKRVVVLAGSGHLIYNLGINRRAYEQSRWPFKTVIGVFVGKNGPAATVARSLGDYVWGTAEDADPAFPSVGLGFKKVNGLANLVVEAKPMDGAAKGADFEKGDIVLFVDNQAFAEANELRMYLARFGWGTETKFKLLRSGMEKEVVLAFKPSGPDAKK
jgi:uncharacterized iron-regulated protein